MLMSWANNPSKSESPKKVARSVIEYGRLSKLPKSATDIKGYAWSSPFSGEWFLSFKASPEDIQAFIDASQSIKDLEPQVFNSKRQYLPRPHPLPEDFYLNESGHEYFSPSPSAPSWYDPTLNTKGRKYEVPAVDYHNWGEVIINDETNIVFIKIIWS
jgi:hypothetical protein